MPHYLLASRLPGALPYSSAPLSTPRDRYLAALAEAKAAEAEYLAAEAVQREEEALCRRLEEIQLRKQEQEFLGSRYGGSPYASSNSLLNLDTYGYDRLATLRRQVEEKERLHLLALRQAEAEQERRRHAEEAHLLYLKRQEQAVLRLHQEREPARATSLRELRAARAPQIQLKSAEQFQCNCIKQASIRPSWQGLCGNSCQRTRPRFEYSERLALQPAFSALLEREAKAFASESTSAKLKPLPQSSVEVDVQKLLNQLFIGQSEPSKPNTPVAARQHATENPIPAPTFEQTSDILQHFAKMFGLSAQEAQQQVTTPASVSPTKAPTTSHTGAEMLQQFLDLLGLPAVNQGQQSVPQASASSSKVLPRSPAVAEPLQQAFNLFLGQPAKEEQQTSTTPGPSKTPETSLKEQLESRLNNEYYAEVRDTIQAIFASLQGAESYSTTPSSTSDSVGSSKGKTKAVETSTGGSPAATSKDVVNAMNEVHSIQAAFQALEADFTFPTQLDFLASHLASGSPASSDSEVSATVHLAYTSRNHTVRFYEQALSALLAQLDSVDSFGNDDLRAMRKKVVNRVERALEELEREVEGRWRARLSKDTKPVGIEVTELVPTQPEESTTFELVASPGVHEESANAVSVQPTAAPTTEVSDVASEPSNTSALAVLPTTSDAVSTTAEASGPESIVSAGDQPSAPTEIFNTNDESASSSISLAASALTVKGYHVNAPSVEDVSPVETDSADAFLMAPAPDADTVPSMKRPNSKESDDAGSDWSEVEA